MTTKYTFAKCPECDGSRFVFYDENHARRCRSCCGHDGKYFLLKEHYGENNGKWACMFCGDLKTEEELG